MEGDIIRTTSCCINKIIVGRTKREYYDDNIDKIKEYRETNKDKINKTNKQYREEHQDKIKEKYTCPICDGKYTYEGKSHHMKTIKHQKAMERVNNIL